MLDFRIVEFEETDSTNHLAAESGRPGEVFVAAHQTMGRGRLNHRWLAPPGVNLAMSAVLPVADLAIEEVATLPLVVGYAVLEALSGFVDAADPSCPPLALKWPNDVLVGPRKICGILCERHGDSVVAGIGINVLPREFPPELAAKATWLSRHCRADAAPTVRDVREAVLASLGGAFDRFCRAGFAAFLPELRKVDFLRGRVLSVRQTDDDAAPIRGLCGGIASDGSLDVGGRLVYAGEAHILEGGR